MSKPENNFSIIKKANKEMLDFFNNAFVTDLEKIQDLKTQLFEIEVKIDELSKTREVYAFKTSSKKSVFTPLMNDNLEEERGKIIADQVADLKDIRETLARKIKSYETDLISLKRRLAVLNDAENAIHNLAIEHGDILETEATYSEDGFEFVVDNKTNSTSHGYNILMQNAFEKAYIATLLDRNIKDGITGINHKLEMLSYLLSTDVSRAKITLKDIINSSNDIIDYIDIIAEKLDSNIDSSKPIWNLLDEFIMSKRDAHPEIIIDSQIEITDYELNFHPVFSINLINILEMLFDNIFKHANANSITLKLSLSSNIVDVNLRDNGMGISNNYLLDSPWYSSLHRIHEIIHLLEGKFEIKGDLMGGTSVRFSFPVQIQ